MRPLVLLFIVPGRGNIQKIEICRLSGSRWDQQTDCIAAEEPLEIRVEGHSVAVVMRTPGDDVELAAGFLVTEGLIKDRSDVRSINPAPHCPTRVEISGRSGYENVIEVCLSDPSSINFSKLTRHVFTSSSCGICSKASIDAVRTQFAPIQDECQVEAAILLRLPEILVEAQEAFKSTGGLHACALFDLKGTLTCLREDVGRHNALDKIIGHALLERRLPLSGNILLLSGRVSFEMMQKSLAAGISIVAAISAPSSLAVQFARDSGQTLVGFIRHERMNIYAGTGRVRGREVRPSPMVWHPQC